MTSAQNPPQQSNGNKVNRSSKAEGENPFHCYKK